MPTLHVAAIVVGLLMVQTVLRDAFETVVLPRRPAQRRRITVLYSRLTWPPVRRLVSHLSPGRADVVLNYFGPLWMLGLISFWAALLIVAFAVLGWGAGLQYHIAVGAPPGFLWDLYISGTTLFTLGMDDIYPTSGAARVIAIAEAGVGLALLALVIGYVPVLYSAFSRREVMVSLLDARAGSPPTGLELLRRGFDGRDAAPLNATLAEFERWGAELLEVYLSYPVLMFYRSQHDRESWLGAVVAVADACAILLAAGDQRLHRQAGFTFAVLRHLLVDITPYNADRAAPAPPRTHRGRRLRRAARWSCSRRYRGRRRPGVRLDPAGAPRLLRIARQRRRRVAAHADAAAHPERRRPGRLADGLLVLRLGFAAFDRDRRGQPAQQLRLLDARDLDDLHLRGPARDDADTALRHAEAAREQPHEGLVRRAVHGRRGDTHQQRARTHADHHIA